MVEQALACLEESDSFSAIEFLNEQPDATAVAEAYFEIVTTLYWEKRDINGVIAMSRAGMQYCSDRAAEAAAAGDMTGYLTLRSTVKKLAYNLASFTWPGWAEPDLHLEEAQVEAGIDAARQNLRLALELDKGALPMSRAYWMLAGHLLTRRAYAGAQALFLRAELYARRAAALDEAMNARAFYLMACWLHDPRNDQRRLSYEEAYRELSAIENGEFYQGQLDAALGAVLGD